MSDHQGTSHRNRERRDSNVSIQLPREFYKMLHIFLKVTKILIGGNVMLNWQMLFFTSIYIYKIKEKSTMK